MKEGFRGFVEKNFYKAAAPVLGGVLAIGIACGNGQEEVTPNPNQTPDSGFQLPPKPEAGASCQGVIDYLSELSGPDGYIEAGDFVIDIGNVSSAPELNYNARIYIPANSQQELSDAYAGASPQWEDWFNGTEVEGQIKTVWYPDSTDDGIPQADNNVGSVQPTGPDQGVVCLDEN